MNAEEAITRSAEEIGLTLKPKQLEAIQKFCSGKDVFVSLPTGYGKSVIYAIMPSIFDKLRGSAFLSKHDMPIASCIHAFYLCVGDENRNYSELH